MTRSIQLRPSSVSAAVLTAEERSKFKWLVVLFSKKLCDYIWCNCANMAVLESKSRRLERERERGLDWVLSWWKCHVHKWNNSSSFESIMWLQQCNSCDLHLSCNSVYKHCLKIGSESRTRDQFWASWVLAQKWVQGWLGPGCTSDWCAWIQAIENLMYN